MTQTKETKKTAFKTPVFRVCYPQVFEPAAAQEGAPKFYSITMAFPPETDLLPMKREIARVLTEKYGADQSKWPKPLELPFRDSKDKPKIGLPPGWTLVNAKTKTRRPGLVDQKVQDIVTPADFYGGCWAQATVNAYAWEFKNMKKGASFGLGNIQKVRDDEPLGNATRAEDDFDAIDVPEGASGDNAKPSGDPLSGLE
jgi:hypothetical protein